jgi:chromosome segregation ATPase
MVNLQKERRMAKKETVGFKVDPDLAEKVRVLQSAAGGTAQDFVEILLAAYADRQMAESTDSPIYKEQVKVRQAFAQAERVVGAFLELAAADKMAAEEHARDAVIAAEEKVTTVTVENKDLKIDLEAVRNERDKLQVLTDSLQDKEANVKALKDAWVEKETSLNTRLAELDVEAKQGRELKGMVSDLEKQITEKDTTVALVTQQSKNEQAAIADLKTRLEKTQNRFAGLEKDLAKDRDALTTEKLDGATRINAIEKEAAEEKGRLTGIVDSLEKELVKVRDALATEKLNCATRISVIEKEAAEEKGRLTGTIDSLEKDLTEKNKLQEKFFALESEMANVEEENKGLREEVENLKTELMKVKKK